MPEVKMEDGLLPPYIAIPGYHLLIVHELISWRQTTVLPVTYQNHKKLSSTLGAKAVNPQSVPSASRDSWQSFR